MMNERILKLAEQAGASVSTIGGVFVNKTNLNIEKFAELIAKECAGIYCKIDNGNLHMGTDDYTLALKRTFEVKNENNL